MTPAIEVLKKNKISHRIHRYLHEPSSETYGREAAEKMGVSESRVFKTLIVNLDNNELAVGIVPVAALLDMKHLAKAARAKKTVMAEPSAVERSTGYVLGGVSPLGQKKRLRTFLDSSATKHSTIYVSAGRRGLEIELSPSDLLTITNGTLANICQ